MIRIHICTKDNIDRLRNHEPIYRCFVGFFNLRSNEKIVIYNKHNPTEWGYYKLKECHIRELDYMYACPEDLPYLLELKEVYPKRKFKPNVLIICCQFEPVE